MSKNTNTHLNKYKPCTVVDMVSSNMGTQWYWFSYVLYLEHVHHLKSGYYVPPASIEIFAKLGLSLFIVASISHLHCVVM